MPIRLNREAVYVAVANLVFSDPGVASLFQTTGRLLPHEANVPDSACPALYTFQLPEKRTVSGRGMEAKRELFVAFCAYFAVSDPTAVLPATLVNAAADAIDNAISYPPNPSNVQTLGGLVEHVTVEPDIHPYEGLLQNRSILVAVVKILVP